MSIEPDVRDEADDQAAPSEGTFNLSMVVIICALVAAAIVLGLLFA